MLENYVRDEVLLKLLREYLSRTACRGENYRDIRQGIPLRSPLSPLMGRSIYTPWTRPWRDIRPATSGLWMMGLFLPPAAAGFGEPLRS